MAYLHNTWYLAAWDEEVTRALMSRVILEESILFYRKEDGSAVAMSNRCPHRFAPLSKGELIGDKVQCPYHGLQFNSQGQCVYNPHPHGKGTIPPRAKLKLYPVIERFSGIWIWMGDQEPDESLLPDYHEIDHSENFRTVRGVFTIDNHYEMVVDNGLDLTHVTYVHAGGLGGGAENVSKEIVKLEIIGTTLWCKRFNYGIEAGSDFRRFNPVLQTIKVDKQQNVRWDPPCNLQIVIKYCQANHPEKHRTSISAGNMLAPVSERQTRVFWSVTRNFLLENKQIDAAMILSAQTALVKQDKPMIEDQLIMMGSTDLEQHNPVYIADDATPIRARAILKKLIKKEQNSQSHIPINLLEETVEASL